jgi:tRNA G18 (ribose-2'-O)-methylase SpoU
VSQDRRAFPDDFFLVHTGRVPHTVALDSPDDPRLADYTRLTDVSLRTHFESEHGLFIAEGTKVITRAIAAGYPLRSILLARSRLPDLQALIQASHAGQTGHAGQASHAGHAGHAGQTGHADQTSHAKDAPVYVVPDEVAERLTGYRVHRGALAALARKPLPPVSEVIAAASKIVILEDLVDHANVGAIFRCAAALGIDAVILSPRCADPLYRRAVKVSMGAVLAIRYARMDAWYDGLAEIKKAGFRVLALTPDETATPITEALHAAEAGKRAALLLGTEGDGLSARWQREADERVRIPMNPAARAAGVDSLNVVAAAAIACHLLATAGSAPPALP